MIKQTLGGFAAILLLAGSAAAGEYGYTGPNGGTVSGTAGCYDGAHVNGCRNRWNYTSPSGETYNGGRGVWRGPARGGSYGYRAGPQGNGVARGRVWRY